MASSPNADGGQQDFDVFGTPTAQPSTPRSSKSQSPRGTESPEKPAPKVRRAGAESVHGVPLERHTPRVEASLQEEVSTSTVAIRTRAAEGPRAFGDGAGGNEFGDSKPSVSSEGAAGGFNPAAAGAEEAGLPLCDCCGSYVVAAALITYMVMKCVPGEEAVSLEYFCPICYVFGS